MNSEQAGTGGMLPSKGMLGEKCPRGLLASWLSHSLEGLSGCSPDAAVHLCCCLRPKIVCNGVDQKCRLNLEFWKTYF